MKNKKKPFDTRKIYIRFAGDNDFINSVGPFVRQLAYNVFKGDCKNKTITKEQIVQLFNNHIYSFYMLHQRCEFEEHPETKEYLKIEVKDVMFDAEVDEFAASGNINHDGAVGYVDYKGDIDIYIL